LEQNQSHPRCIILIEAREESGSQDLPAYVEFLKDQIGIPSLVICLDSGCGNYEQFWMTTSLRGAVIGSIEVRILKEAVHSGHASGIVPSSFRIIRQILNRIENAETGEVLIPEFNKEIPLFRIEQQKEAAEILGDELYKEFPFIEGAKPMHHDLLELLLNRTWRPTVSYTGIDGFPSVSEGGNVLRTHSSLKISVRTPPHVDAKKAAEALKNVIEKDPPYGAQVKFHLIGAMSGWQSPKLSPWLEKSIEEAGLQVFGKRHAYLGEGGSIPFMGMLGEKFPKAQFVITGVLGPNSNAHGPNEFLHIQMAKNITTIVSFILVECAKQKEF
jgi:acetylornithine deacetylase/succinyl-diaminopimelate desuccinylase-like protein